MLKAEKEKLSALFPDFEIVSREKLSNSYNDYLSSCNLNLWDAYGRFSYQKERAFDYCENLRVKYGGFRACIPSHNTCTFTYGFIILNDEGRFYAHITKSHNYLCKLA